MSSAAANIGKHGRAGKSSGPRFLPRPLAVVACPAPRRKMGCGASTAQVPPRQLVLLGGGECGKTTIFKQIQLLHGSGFSDEVRNDWISAVCSSPLRSMRAILTKADELGLEVDSVSAHCCHRRARTRRPERGICPWWSRGRGVGGVWAQGKAALATMADRSRPSFPRRRPRRRRSWGSTSH